MSTSRMEYDNVPEQQAAYDEGKRAGRAEKGLYYSGPHTPHFLNGVKAGRAERGAEVSHSKQATAYQPLNGCMCQDGSCEACNQAVGAFEAMRETLRAAPRPPFESSYKKAMLNYGLASTTWHARLENVLALADEAAKGKP